jgi:nucleolin
MGKRFIKVDRPLQPRAAQPAAVSAGSEAVRPPGCKTVFIKNLPYECTEEEISLLFQVYGKIDEVRLAKWGHTNHLKGFGYIEFKKEDSAEIAVRKSGSIIIKERAVQCDFETGKPKGSFRSGDGGQQRVHKKAKK